MIEKLTGYLWATSEVYQPELIQFEHKKLLDICSDDICAIILTNTKTYQRDDSRLTISGLPGYAGGKYGHLHSLSVELEIIDVNGKSLTIKKIESDLDEPQKVTIEYRY